MEYLMSMKDYFSHTVCKFQKDGDILSLAIATPKNKRRCYRTCASSNCRLVTMHPIGYMNWCGVRRKVSEKVFQVWGAWSVRRGMNIPAILPQLSSASSQGLTFGWWCPCWKLLSWTELRLTTWRNCFSLVNICVACRRSGRRKVSRIIIPVRQDAAP